MGNSLRDQMLKAGLVSKGKVKQQQQNSRKNRRRKAPQGDKPDAADASSQAQAAMRAQQQRDRALNLEREQARQRKALRVQMRQLLRSQRVNDNRAEDRYNFTVGDKLKSLYVTPPQRSKLMAGELAIILFGDSQYLVPLAAVDKARALDAGVLVYLAEPVADAAEPDADDPYADFKVPDDLMW